MFVGMTRKKNKQKQLACLASYDSYCDSVRLRNKNLKLLTQIKINGKKKKIKKI